MARSETTRPPGRFRVTVQNERTGEEELLYNPEPQQDRLHACTKRNVLYGGAAGGGKSHGLRWHGFLACLRHSALKVLLLRREYTDLETTHLLEIPAELPDYVAKYHTSLKRLNFPNGSIMKFGHCKTEKDVAGYLSSQWDMILIDEASTFTPRMIRMLASRLRTTRKGVVPQLVLGTNPGGDAHLYILQRYIEKSVPEGEQRRYVPSDYEFIPSKLEDNCYIDEEEYDARLQELSEDEYKAYRLGDWYSFAGQYFKAWTPKTHCVQLDDLIDEDWEVQGGMDWGYSPSPGVIELAAFDPHGRALPYKEIVFEECSGREVAELIDAKCVTPKERSAVIYGDTQMWAPQASSGVSIADEINERLAELGCGVSLVKANKDRPNGWARVRTFLKPTRKQPEGTQPAAWRGLPKGIGPWMRVARVNDELGYGCPYLIATIGAQVHDERMTGDMKKGPTDHACDALRYLLIAREPLTVISAARQPQATSTERHWARTKRMLQRAILQNQQEGQLEVLEPGGIDGDGITEAANLDGMFT